MEKLIPEFKQYLKEEKNMAQNSLEAYERDIVKFMRFVREKGINEIADVTGTDIVSYVLKLKNDGKSGSTVNRKISAIRAFCTFIYGKGILGANPALNIRSPQIEKKTPVFLSVEEMETLLAQPDEKTLKGKRDKALMEVMYATGIRVSELVEMNAEDVNVRMGFCAFSGEFGKARIIPLGRAAKEALEDYLKNGRAELLRGNAQERALFVNYAGERMTRQGLWKVLKYYADKALPGTPLTPQTIRHSFAAHMIRNGADLKSLQELMGHEDISTTQIYLGTAKNRIKEVYDKAHPRA